ncbi:uroporphyrinogen-III synthase /uroporphyrinogen-III C-methyltransferase [Abditibacterium utsteinense]|uniref:uroporphyrinogen-III C-methyltransferase n=1 Tax=Abditibacterium utsteinense TaxID=1960156 RepID=A0A2S8SRV5_9BACT|nr:uroporphyrinogen-III C-methyltransferase [Abditibacterium utsteinense]PQV63479.1 uroporphyrinogen-III synthase /uroporphyrinogen-III C-methyltransferase [Abditibacterium utsteinense]
MATVYLVGAGPGDVGLLTRRAFERVQSADVIVYDALVNPEMLDFSRPDAEKIYVGKRAGQHSLSQDEINALLIEHAQNGKNVCRLKGGDPFVFGRGGEEALACVENGIPFEIVPGISSALAAPAYAGIPVTHREIATSFAVVTGHTASDDAPPDAIPQADTLVFLMGVKALPLIVARLLERGDNPQKPVALVRWGTRAEQQTVVGTLETIEDEVRKAKLKSPAMIVIGEVVNLREKLRWFDNRPLWGKTVVVTRAREQASSLVEGLQKLGARVVQCPTIRVEPLAETSVLEAEIPLLMRNEWVVFTSTNGVEMFFKKLDELHLDARIFGPALVAAIGPATVTSLQKRGIKADFVPESSISEAVASGLLERGAGGKRVLILRALEGREVLEEKLREGHATVASAPIYRTLPDNSNARHARELMEAGQIDWVSFTSSSTVKNFVDALGAEFVAAHRDKFKVAAIGPVTAQSAQKFGLEPDVVAESASVEALAAALLH